MKPYMRSIAVVAAAILTLATVGCSGNSSHSFESGTESMTESVTESISESSSEPKTDSETESETMPPEEKAERPAEEVKVVSFNLDANEATISQRSRLLLPLIKSFEPDSIGVQEARGSWISQLNRLLVRDGYTRVGVDAGGNENGSPAYFATFIFFRTDKYTLVDSGTFWMSKTPDVPSIYDNTVDCNRTCTWALLENKETGFRYVHMNTHLDWMNMEVNRIQVAMIREQIERFSAMGYPVFATGDYNCDEGTGSYREMLKSDLIGDSKHLAEKTMDLGTYPSYGKYDVTKTEPIDYVFVTKDMMKVLEYKVIDDKPDGQYVSDHNGLFVHAAVQALPIRPDTDTVPTLGEGNMAFAAIGPSSATVTFPQARDALGHLASLYRVELMDAAGTLLKALEVSSGMLTLEPADTVTVMLEDLVSSTTYTVRITPLSLFGIEGTPCTGAPYLFESSAPAVTPEVIGSADIFDLSVKDGRPVDISAAALPITVLGEAEIDGNEHIFTASGNYKVSAIKNHYAQLQDGFTVEWSFTTGGDITTYQNPAANYHAGGFGIEVDNGRLKFGVRIGEAYVRVDTAIETTTTYHCVAIFDPVNQTLSLYKNGVLADACAVSGRMGLPTEAGASYLCIGADSDATGQGEYPFVGRLEILRIYSDAASAGQALWLWENAQA